MNIFVGSLPFSVEEADLRNKDKNKMNPGSKSRKSDASKKNKKRWY